MDTLASETVLTAMRMIEDARAQAETTIGQHNARDIALGELRLLLSEQQEALESRPYGYGHAWNVWAVTVAIEQLRRGRRAPFDGIDDAATAARSRLDA